MIKIRRILWPIDFFPASERAADYAIALAKNYGATLTLLHVVSPVVSESYEVPLNVTAIIEAMSSGAKAQLKRVEKRAVGKGVTVKSIVRIGNVDSEIRSFVEKGEA